MPVAIAAAICAHAANVVIGCSVSHDALKHISQRLALEVPFPDCPLGRTAPHLDRIKYAGSATL